MMAARARNGAEWSRNPSIKMARGLREIDREANQVNKAFIELEQGVVRTAMIGGTMARQEIAKFNEDIDDTCNYCMEAASTTQHIRWQCKHFQFRTECGSLLTTVPASTFWNASNAELLQLQTSTVK